MASRRGHRSRKMAAILHADVVGSTGLVQRSESLAHERINDAFGRFSLSIKRYGGTVHEVRGDALVAEFSRASDAVCAALDFQKSHTQRLFQVSDDITPTIRVGISLGEVIFADGTVTGAGVVLAQRVEQLAAPGGICITGAIHETLPQHMPFDQDDLGEQAVKGFIEPVRVYAVRLQQYAETPSPESTHTRWRTIAAATIVLAVVATGVAIGLKPWQTDTEPASMDHMANKPPSEPSKAVLPVSKLSGDTEPGALREADQPENPSLAAPDKPSIAVLPFTNMSGDPEQEYFADGITEDLTTDLSKISGLFVVARHSSFAYKGKSADVRTVGRELGVKYVLEGSVRRVGNQIRINAQLIDATSGGHLWAERFDGTMADVFSLQDHVNNNIVTALEVSLTVDDRKRLGKVETANPDAYDMLLRGLEQYQLFGPETNLRSRAMFEQAVALDHSYARAYANVALTYASEVNFNWAANREEAIKRGLEFAARASELDDSIPQIYLTRSMLYLAQRRYEAAVEAGKRTVEVHPSYADGHAALAFVLSYAGQPDEALEAIQTAMQLNPQYSYIYLAVQGRVLFLLGRYEEATAALEESVHRNPVFDQVQLVLAATYAQLDRLDDAAWAVDEALVIRSDISLESERRAANYMRAKDVDHYIEALRKAGVPER